LVSPRGLQTRVPLGRQLTVAPAIQEVYYDPGRYPDREPHPRDGRHGLIYC
jgi:hypothetical protein